MVNGAIREQSIVCSVRIFGTSGIAPHTACRIPRSPIGPYGGDRAAGADPGPAQTSYNLYDAYRAATARPCARPTRAGPIVLACESAYERNGRNANGIGIGERKPRVTRVLYLLTPPYTQSRCASTITVYCRACPHATDTNHAYGLCCMHYVCITFRVPCSGVGATSGPCGVWPRIRQRLTSCIFARVRDAPPERQGQRDEPSSALRLQIKVLRRLALPTKPLASRSMHLTEQSMQRILQQLPWHPPLSPTFQAQPSPRLPWIPSTTRGRS